MQKGIYFQEIMTSRLLLNKLPERYNRKIKFPVFYSAIGTNYTHLRSALCYFSVKVSGLALL